MIACDEEALICDLAETYQILNYKELPVRLLATLSVGLRADSRIKMKLNKEKLPTNTVLLASIVDELNILIWQNTKDGQDGVNKPKLLMSTLLETNNSDNVECFDDGEDFIQERKKLLKKLEEVNNCE